MPANDVPECFRPPGSVPRQALLENFNEGSAITALIAASGARRVVTVPVGGAGSLFWFATARPNPLTTDLVQALGQVAERAVGTLDQTEAPETQLAWLQPLAIAGDLAAALVSVRDVRGMFSLGRGIFRICGQPDARDADAVHEPRARRQPAGSDRVA